MITNKRKLEIAMANACMNPYDLCKVAEIRYQTYQRITSGKDAKPASKKYIVYILYFAGTSGTGGKVII